MRDAAAHRIQLIVLEAALAALAVVVGFLLAFLPNVELFTFVVFIAGVLLGWPSGARVGTLAALAYGILSPYGLPSPLLLVSLVGSRTLIGALGGVLRKPLSSGPKLRRTCLFALAAVLCTLILQTLTNIAVGLTVGEWGPIMVGALPFALVNLASNVASFTLLGVSTTEVARRLPIPGLQREDG